MKIERLLSMIIYLLNHQRVSASRLADHFEVSIRTIQRDIDTLTLAGIPIIAYTGADGGYEIMDTYKAHIQLANNDDYRIVVAALKGFQSALENPQINETLDKFQSLSQTEQGHIVLDFGVLKEKKEIHRHMQDIETAIVEQKLLTFTYTNARNEVSIKTVEPFAIVYKWYSWYLLAHSQSSSNYRYYKVIRMEDCKVEHKQFQNPSISINEIIQSLDTQDTRNYVDLIVLCKKDCKIKAMEFLNGNIIEQKENGDYVMSMHLPIDEELWKGAFLSFGDALQVIKPKEVREMLQQRCKQFLTVNYDIEVS